MMFSGNLLLMLPKVQLDKSILDNAVAYLNSEEFKENFIQSGRFKISQNQLSNTKIPHFL